ncbi:MAG: hypothetical protein U0271_31470 [Polyangiaceae bacterium]
MSRHPHVARFRGQAFRSLLAALGSVLGPSSVAAVLAELRDRQLPGFDAENLRSTDWYSVSAYAEVHRAAQSLSGRGTDLARELGAEAMRVDARGVYQFLLRFVSPTSLMRNAERVAALYIDGPRIQVEQQHAGDATIQITDALGFDASVWQDFVGSISSLLTLSGAIDPMVELVSGGNVSGGDVSGGNVSGGNVSPTGPGDTFATMRARWR